MIIFYSLLRSLLNNVILGMRLALKSLLTFDLSKIRFKVYSNSHKMHHDGSGIFLLK